MSSLCSVRMLVKSVSLFTWPISASLLSLRKPFTSPRAWLSVPSVLSRSVVLSANTCDTEATWPVNCTICSLLFDSALMSTCRLRMVPNRSVRESPSLPAVCDSSRSASRNESPLPSKVSAAWFTNELSGPCMPPCCGPSSRLSADNCSLTSSHSTGTAVAVQPDARAVGQRRSAGVGGRELNEAGGHQIRRDDQRLRIGGHLHPVVQGHGDLHVARARFDRVDLSDRHTDDADIVTRIQAHRRCEIADDLVAGPRRPHQVDADGQHSDQHGGQCDPQPSGAVRGRIRVGHGGTSA